MARRDEQLEGLFHLLRKLMKRWKQTILMQTRNFNLNQLYFLWSRKNRFQWANDLSYSSDTDTSHWRNSLSEMASPLAALELLQIFDYNSRKFTDRSVSYIIERFIQKLTLLHRMSLVKFSKRTGRPTYSLKGWIILLIKTLIEFDAAHNSPL